MSGSAAETPGTAKVVPGEFASLSEAQLEEFRAEWERQANGTPRLLTPLPWRLRLRLWLARRIDLAAIWLVNRERHNAAIRLWRLFGMWKP